MRVISDQEIFTAVEAVNNIRSSDRGSVTNAARMICQMIISLPENLRFAAMTGMSLAVDSQYRHGVTLAALALSNLGVKFCRCADGQRCNECRHLQSESTTTANIAPDDDTEDGEESSSSSSIDNWFAPRTLTAYQYMQRNTLESAIKDVAHVLDHYPPSKSRATAFLKLRETVMWARAAQLETGRVVFTD